MILSSTQVELDNGLQLISFYTTTQPTQATFGWTVVTRKDKEDHEQFFTQTVPVTFNAETGHYEARCYVPANEFSVGLDTESVYPNYESDWRDPKSNRDETIPLSVVDGIAAVPYCDVSRLGLKFYDSDLSEMDVWWDYYKTPVVGGAYIAEEYGAPTLLVGVDVIPDKFRKRGWSGWARRVDMVGELYYVDLVDHQAVVTDPVARKTIVRESLYGKTYRGEVQL